MTERYEALPLGDPTMAQSQPALNTKTKLLHLPKSKPVDLVFNNISFTVTSGLFTKSQKQVLRGVSGKFCSGELTAIMGPSGSGKSSLLNVLTGFQRDGMKGSIFCSSRDKKGSDAPLDRKDCCYIMQDDNLTPLLTVREAMIIAANLKLKQNMSKKSKLLLVENIIESVGMSLAENIQCKSLSGGQRKRLSVALELINNPPVMFLDEPTTGLDSQNASQIVELFRSLARGGRTIICTLHQPSASVFEMFDHMYVIAGGYCVFQGASANMLPFLHSVGLPCPQYHNPADFVLDVITGEFGDHTQVLVDAATNSVWRGTPPKLQEDIYNCDNDNHLITHQSPPSEWYRFRILLKRTLKLMVRDWTVVYLKMAVHLMTGLLIGALFQQAGMDGDKAVSNIGYFMTSVVYLSYTSLIPAILKFPSELGVIKKEQFNNWYKLRTFYVAFLLSNLPIQMLFCAQYIAISYYLTSQIMEGERFCMFLLVNLITIVISECLGLGLGTTINPVNGIFLGAVGICFMILMAGFLALLRDMPSVLYYVAYSSYMRYTLEGMVLSIYSYDRENMFCLENYCHYRAPVAILDELGMRYGDYWRDVTALVLIAVFSIFYAYYSLRAKMK